jgi:CheY-like chemotaxis protein
MRRILVVDDEYVVLDALAMMLEAEGYRVRKASDGAEAWQRLDEEIPDVVLCDVQMPVMDGIALMERMATEPRVAGVPVILMLEAYGRKPAGIARARAVITKPVRFRDLCELLAAEGFGVD